MAISGRGWRVRGRRQRLEVACRRLGIRTLVSFLDAVERRASSERQLCEGVYGELLGILEPPNCEKYHCEHHTSGGFAGCALNRTPGRCKEHREYLKRRKARQDKAKQEQGTA